MNISNKDQGNRADDALEALFRRASVRQRAPQERELEIRAALRSEWGQLTRRRRVRKQVLVWASAASVVLALFVTTVSFRQTDPVQRMVVATVGKQLGEVLVGESGAGTAPLAADAQLVAGSELSTEQEARLALNWVNGESVRVDQGSRLSLVSDSEISLSEGKIYVDSRGAGASGTALVIQTPRGPVQHIGTQYMTMVHRGEVTVSVREGEVSIGSGDEMSIAVKGQRLRVTQAGQHSTTSIPTYGNDWQWAELVVPRYGTDGRSIHEFLEWVGRETGRSIEYGSIEAEKMATETRMHGDVDLEPLHAMELMLQTSDLVPSVKDGVILVSL